MIKPRKQTRLCVRCQKRVARAIKCAKSVGLICETQGWTVVNTLGYPTRQQKEMVSKTI
jgi:hypothetical protein